MEVFIKAQKRWNTMKIAGKLEQKRIRSKELNKHLGIFLKSISYFLK